MEIILETAAKLACNDLIISDDILQGSAKFNSLFIAQLFHRYPNLQLPPTQMSVKAGTTPATQFATQAKPTNIAFDDIGTREERGN
jgi:hypothetical protein